MLASSDAEWDVYLRELASACARGSRQQGLINQLLAHCAYKQSETVYNRHIDQDIVVVTYGLSKVTHKSFINLRDRLQRAGFVVCLESNRRLTMYYPRKKVGTT